MDFVARGVALQFGEPPFTTVSRCRAIIATAMTMPEAAVDKDDGLVFRQNDVGTDEAAAQKLMVEDFCSGGLRPPDFPLRTVRRS